MNSIERENLVLRVSKVVSGHGPQYVRDVINIIEALGYDIVERPVVRGGDIPEVPDQEHS